MAVVRWTPQRLFDPFAEIDRVFDAMFPSFNAATRRSRWYPAADVHETADTVEVTVELPGMSHEDIELTVKDNVLTISGEKKYSREEKDEDANVYYAERQYGKFERSLTLPAYVEADKAEATFKDGVLTVTLPKVEHQRSRQIQISTE